MKTPTSAQMAYLAGRIKGWASILIRDKDQTNFHTLIEDMDICSKEIAEEFTDVDLDRYYPNET